MIAIQGHVDDGWGPVADAFQRNFEAHDELGAACCVYVGGRPVVDLWGGIADARTGRAWERDTVAVVFSTTKGATAICAHMLVERGELDLEAPVAAYWPEFGAAGKGEIRVRWLLSHQAGLPTVEVPMTLEEACAWEPVIRALERQRPLWEPGTRRAYHALTWGFLVGEVIRRVTGKTPGAFFADEVASPLGLSAWIGLPEEQEPRVAHLCANQSPADIDAFLDGMLAQLPSSVIVPDGTKAALMRWIGPESVNMRAHELGGAFPRVLVTEEGGHNARIVRASEYPASGMVSDARSIAGMYAATVGEVDGVRLLEPATVAAMTAVQPSRPYGVPPEIEPFISEVFPSAISLGFQRPTRLQPLMGEGSFGHYGAGGSLGFADSAASVGFGYVMNRMAPDQQTANLLAAAVAACVG